MLDTHLFLVWADTIYSMGREPNIEIHVSQQVHPQQFYNIRKVADTDGDFDMLTTSEKSKL